jgi:hypothetical protein
MNSLNTSTLVSTPPSSQYTAGAGLSAWSSLQLLPKLRAAQAQLEAAGRPATAEALAEPLELSPGRVAALLELAQQQVRGCFGSSRQAALALCAAYASGSTHEMWFCCTSECLLELVVCTGFCALAVLTPRYHSGHCPRHRPCRRSCSWATSWRRTAAAATAAPSRSSPLRAARSRRSSRGSLSVRTPAPSFPRAPPQPREGLRGARAAPHGVCGIHACMRVAAA